jgi:hypothetical protein
MTTFARIQDIFNDAYDLHTSALERLEQGDIRDASEKAWCATKRATDALILSKTGEEPRTSGQTMKGVRSLRRVNAGFESLQTRYGSYQSFLHGACFYDGVCEPEDALVSDIRNVYQYIRDAEALAGG